VLASAQMAGDGPTVIAAAEKLRGLIPDEVARSIALVQPVKAAPYFAHALFSPSATVLALPDPGDAIPYVKAMWHYARGIAYVAQGDFAAAKAEAKAIAALEGGDFTLLKSSGVPAQDVLALARTVIEARVAQRQGDKAAAIERFERAAALQDGLPYMEPPYWYYPVRQSLAVALMQAGRLDEAEEQFQRALKRAPGNGWSWYGLAELYRARGKADQPSKLDGGSCQDVDRRPTAVGAVEVVTSDGRVKSHRSWQPAVEGGCPIVVSLDRQVASHETPRFHDAPRRRGSDLV
jgi:tetratricopeptide (TPR) repeat protein